MRINTILVKFSSSEGIVIQFVYVISCLIDIRKDVVDR